MTTSRIDRQISFLLEADRLKSVLRATTLADGSRHENSGEHSWHLALFALVFRDQAPEGADAMRAIEMLLLHDLVEIDVGDVPIHSQGGTAHSSVEIAAKEAAAALRIFGLLPDDLRDDLHATWQEFEAGETPTARFARALDRVQPVLLNHASGGGSWLDYDVSWEQLQTRVGVKVERGAPSLWAAVCDRIKPWFSARNRV